MMMMTMRRPTLTSELSCIQQSLASCQRLQHHVARPNVTESVVSSRLSVFISRVNDVTESVVTICSPFCGYNSA